MKCSCCGHNIDENINPVKKEKVVLWEYNVDYIIKIPHRHKTTIMVDPSKQIRDEAYRMITEEIKQSGYYKDFNIEIGDMVQV